MPAIRVLHVYKDVFPPIVGGIERHIDSIRRALPDFTHDVLACSRQLHTRIIQSNGGREVLTAELTTRVLSVPVAPTFPLWFRRMAPNAIVHLHMPQPLAELTLVTAHKRWPIVVSYHADIYRQRMLLPVYRPLVVRCLRIADRVVVGSRTIRDTSPIMRAAGVTPAVIPYAIDTSSWGPRSADTDHVNALRKLYGEKHVISVGRLVHYKGFDDLISAAARFESHVVIVGDGPLRPTLERLIDDLGVRGRVHLVGEVSERQLVDHLAAASVFALPSTNRAEAFGISILEAQASELPVVVTDVGTGTLEAFEPGRTGLLVPPRDPDALAHAIRQLLDNRALRIQMGSAGRQRVVEHHSLLRLAADLRPLYLRLANG